MSDFVQVETEAIVTLDHRLTGLFNGAMLLLAEFLLLNNEDAENTNKLRRAYSTTDGELLTAVSVNCVLNSDDNENWLRQNLYSVSPKSFREATFLTLTVDFCPPDDEDKLDVFVNELEIKTKIDSCG